MKELRREQFLQDIKVQGRTAPDDRRGVFPQANGTVGLRPLSAGH